MNIRHLQWVLGFLLGLVLAAGVLLTPTLVSAHAFLQRTQPAAGTVVAATVGEVRLTFNERVEVRADKIAVTDTGGRRVDRRDAHAAPNDPLSVAVSLPELSTGVYTVRYALVSADTHPVTGEFRFGVGVAPADLLLGTAETEPTGLTPPLLLQALARGLILLGLSLWLGPLAFRLSLLLFTPARQRSRYDDFLTLFEPTIVRWIWLAFGLVVLGQLCLLISAAYASAFGGGSEFLQPGNLLGALTGRFGTLWLSRLALLIAPALTLPILSAELELRAADEEPIASLSGQRAWLLLLIAGLAYALVTSISGHAATTDPILLSILVDWVHLVASSAWLGGVLILALVLPRMIRALPVTAQFKTLLRIILRFSALALVAIQLLIVTGFYQTWVHVDGPLALGQSLYGGTLLVKLLLLVPLLGFAAMNRFWILPRLVRETNAPTAQTIQRLWQTLWGEMTIGMVVLLVVGLLTALPPARTVVSADAPASAPANTTIADSVTLAMNAGPTLVTLTIGPTTTGPAVLNVTLQDSAGGSLTDAAVTLRLTATNGAVPQEVPLVARDGRYTGLGELGKPGHWQLEALVTPRGGGTDRAVFNLDLPTGGARSLLAQSDLAMNQLTGLREHQTITGSGAPITTDYQWVAPNRMHLRSEAGSETIVVGKQRYDRPAGGNWVQSVWPEPAGYRWPIFDNASISNEVTLLGRETIAGTPCWVVSFLDVPSGSRMTFWIGVDDNLVRRQRMFSVGHYMESTYSDFNAIPPIEPPIP